MFRDRLTIKYLILVSIYTLLSMMAWRLFIIPQFVTSQYGEIVGDYLIYATIGIRKGEELVRFGLSHFELRPEGQGSAGFASLLYALTGSPHYIIILNTLLHVIAVWSLVKILRIWFSEKTAVLASLPFALSFCMMYSFSQTNKESYAISGSLLFTSQYILLFIKSALQKLTHVKEIIFSALLMILGIFLMWIVRPYLIQIFFVAIFAIVPVYLIFFGKTIVRKKHFLGVNVMVFSLLVLFYQVLNVIPSASGNTLSVIEGEAIDLKALGYADGQSVAERCLDLVQEGRWQSGFIPEVIDRKIKVLAVQRCLNFSVLARNPNKTVLFSLVDTDIFMSGPADMLLYVPRAIQIGVFAPWPSQWGTMLTESLSVPYRLTALEAIFVYFCFMALGYTLYKKKFDASIFVPMYLSVVFMVLIGFTCSYLAVTYRYRYVWWMLLASLGFACFIQAIADRKKQQT